MPLANILGKCDDRDALKMGKGTVILNFFGKGEGDGGEKKMGDKQIHSPIQHAGLLSIKYYVDWRHVLGQIFFERAL